MNNNSKSVFMTDLYSTHAKEFSDTRQSPWAGWNRLVSNTVVASKKDIKVLDLGCGNGRFLKFLMNTDLDIAKYIGVDNSRELLDIAENSIDNQRINADFMSLDLEDKNWDQKLSEVTNMSFDLIVVFGVMHHLHKFDIRKKILTSSYYLLNENGILCITYWQFVKMDRFKDKLKKADSVDKDKFSENDYILPFGDNNAVRFCHYVNETELEELEADTGFKVIDQYLSDGKEGNQNLYKLYQK